MKKAKAAPQGAGEFWTWTTLDADRKLIVSFLCDDRDTGNDHEFMAAGSTKTLWPMADLAAVIDAAAEAPKPTRMYKVGSNPSVDNSAYA